MAKYTDQEKQKLQSISIVEIMAHMGKNLYNQKGMYYSPFRDESTPSFHIDGATNRWYDFGTSEGGGLFEFVCRIAGITRGEVYDWLARFRSMIPESEYEAVVEKIKKVKPARIIVDSASHKFTRHKLVEYAEARAVTRQVLERFCEEILYHIDSYPDKQYYAIGFKNNDGGYVLRSSLTKKCTSSAMTTLSPEGVITDQVSGSKVLVFEGFMDFLSWLSNVQQDTPEYDCCILNSVSNIDKALPWITAHNNIAAFMDNDEAGRKTLQKIIENVPDDAGKVCVYDMAKLYEDYNDLNEKLSDELSSKDEHSSINTHNHGDNTI